MVNGTRQGEYLYLASDSRFRGLNVVLATAGAGTANLQWQFWNGTAWADLEAVAGFTDTTNNLKRNGNISWTADPPSWSPSSLAGGPDLYYVRAYVTSGSYTTSPVESRITTDILLFQYCGDVTTNSNFVFAPPVTTEVKLQSFAAVPGDASVTLEWRTASELDNLGFYLYRGPSEAGPWTSLTTSLIPGLGSSATGQAYSYRDAALQNGTRYFYRLEDVDASSKVTSHGPVSAVPRGRAVERHGGERGWGERPGCEDEDGVVADVSRSGWCRHTARSRVHPPLRLRSSARGTGIPRRCRSRSSRATRARRRWSCGREASTRCARLRARCESSSLASTSRRTRRPRRCRSGARWWRRSSDAARSSAACGRSSR